MLRIYGRGIVELGALLDSSDGWSNRSLSTALCLCLGRPGTVQVEALASRIRRSLPGKGSFGTYLSDHHGLTIDARFVDSGIVNWVGGDTSHRLLALGLLAFPLDVSLDEVRTLHDALIRSAAAAPPIALNWTQSMTVADLGRNPRMSLRMISQNPVFRMTAWELLDEFARIASVTSQSAVVRTRAAASSLASGLAADPEEGTAAALLLMLSTASIDFDQIPFGILRRDDAPVGPVVEWISDLFVWIRLAQYGRRVGLRRLGELLATWPFDTLNALPLLVAASSDGGNLNMESPRIASDLDALRSLDQIRLAAWAQDVGINHDEATTVMDSISVAD